MFIDSYIIIFQKYYIHIIICCFICYMCIYSYITMFHIYLIYIHVQYGIDIYLCIYIYIYIYVIYWPSTEPSIKRCTCVNKQKNSGSRCVGDNNITRCPGWFELVADKIPEWEPVADRGLWALSDPRLSNPSQDGEELLLWSEELGSI